MKSYPRSYLFEVKKAKGKGLTLQSFQFLVRDYQQWKKYAAPGTSSVEAQLPWMTFSAIRFLEKNLKPAMNVFEYGCGGSTVFLSKRSAKVISVEHDKEWFHVLGKKLKELGLSNWEGKLIEPEFNGENTKSIADPDEYGTDDKILSQYRFRKYASGIDEYSDDYFDWILVDGRSRPSCMKHAIPKVKPGGFLLLDNADRNYYFEGLPGDFNDRFKVVCADAGPTPFMKEFSKTMIWQKVKK